MALRYLFTEEMVALTTPMVDPAHRFHQILSSRALLAAMLEELRASHVGLSVLRPSGGFRKYLEEVQGEQGTLDIDHDDLMRAMWFRLLAEEHAAQDPAAKGRYRALRKLLLPEGLIMVQRSYRQEAGHGQRVAHQLTDEDRAVLRSVPMGQGTLLDLVERWLLITVRLGELDVARHSAAAAMVTGQTRGDHQRARNRWIRIITMLRTGADVVGYDPELDEVFERLRVAELDADRRRSTQGDAEDADDVDDIGEGDVDAGAGEGDVGEGDGIDVADDGSTGSQATDNL